jgi:uncharacterized repeat protein (TIGR04076 family)
MADPKKAKMYDVEIKVFSRKGKCSAEHNVGDKWVMGLFTPGGLCSTACDLLFPYGKALRCGGDFPYVQEDGLVHVTCPDDGNVVFTVRKIEK